MGEETDYDNDYDSPDSIVIAVVIAVVIALPLYERTISPFNYSCPLKPFPSKLLSSEPKTNDNYAYRNQRHTPPKPGASAN